MQGLQGLLKEKAPFKGTACVIVQYYNVNASISSSALIII